MNHFRRELLPNPKVFFEGQIGPLGRERRGWSLGNCPFHASQSKKSFSVNLQNGCFFCFGCGAKGGDVLAFLRLRYSLTFQDAAMRLGCWDEAPSPATVRKFAEQARERDRQRQLEEAEQRVRRQRLTRLRDQLHGAVARYQETSERLSELHAGASPDWENEQESCWASLAVTLQDWRDVERAYCAAAGLPNPWSVL